MTPNTSELYENCVAYCALEVAYRECKWWQFLKKKAYKDAMDYVYPLMRGEVKTLQATQPQATH